MLKDIMKALTLRKPISMTTTSMTSGTLTTRIAKQQRLHVVRVAAWAAPGWDAVAKHVQASLFKTYALDIQPVPVADAAGALAALAEGAADVALTDVPAAIAAHAGNGAIQFVAVSPALEYGYVTLAPVLNANGYALTRFARALRENTGATYVDASALQALIDRYAAEKRIPAAFPAAELISRVAVMSGVR